MVIFIFYFAFLILYVYLFNVLDLYRYIDPIYYIYVGISEELIKFIFFLIYFKKNKNIIESYLLSVQGFAFTEVVLQMLHGNPITIAFSPLILILKIGLHGFYTIPIIIMLYTKDKLGILIGLILAIIMHIIWDSFIANLGILAVVLSIVFTRLYSYFYKEVDTYTEHSPFDV